MENTKQPKITLPIAIIVAGFLIMIGILVSGGISGKNGTTESKKTLSEQVGVKQDDFKKCLEETNVEQLLKDTGASAELAMKGIPADQRGTPYSVIIGKNGVKADIRGAYTIDDVKKLIEEVKSGKITTPYTGEVPAVNSNDHIIGNPDAPIVIVEYSDLECPYCKRFGEVMKQLVEESNGDVAWVYRHWVVHQGAVAKTAAAECVAKIKGDDAFWKYIDLIFGLMKTEEDTSGVDNL